MRTLSRQLASGLGRLARSEDGAVLVEFALVFPIMLLFFAVIVESSRLMWSYQVAIEGVRDAARYLARTAPVDICETLDFGLVTSRADELKAIVEDDIDLNGLLPPLVTVNSVTAPAPDCVSNPDAAHPYRTDPAPVATVSANLTITFPLGSIFGLFGTSLTSVTTTVTDSARIYGQ